MIGRAVLSVVLMAVSVGSMVAVVLGHTGFLVVVGLPYVVYVLVLRAARRSSSSRKDHL